MNELKQLDFTVTVSRPVLQWSQIEMYLTSNGYKNDASADSPSDLWERDGDESTYLIRLSKADRGNPFYQQTILERLADNEHRPALEVYDDINRMPMLVMAEDESDSTENG